jgi:DnaK suppressor protein
MERNPLTPESRDALRRVLMAKRADIRHRLALHDDEALEGAVDSPELEDIAEGVIEDWDRRRLAEHDRRLLDEVEHALAKFDAGTYGVSEASGRPIPLQRLRALPWARLDEEEAELREHP